MSDRSGLPRDTAVGRDDFWDQDPGETTEWIESLDSVLRYGGIQRGNAVLRELCSHARAQGVSPRALLNTPSRNTIAATAQPAYPGDLELENRITAAVRWNAAAMVVRANQESTEL